MKKRYIIPLVLILSSMILYGCTSNNESNNSSNENEDKPTLVLGQTPWTSTVPPTQITKIILEDMGYDIEVEFADLGVVFSGLASDHIDIFMDYWEPQHKNYMEEYSDSVEITSTSYENADWGLAVPKYMEDINTVEDLKDKEDMFDNEIYAIEEADPAVKDIPKVLDKNNITMEVLHSSEAAMLTVAKEKIKDKEPVVTFAWRPHSMFNLLDIKLLKNENATEFFNSSTVSTVSNKKLKDKAPEAYEFLSNWSIPIDDLEDMITKIDEEEDPEKVAQEWIDENKDKIDEMKIN